MPKIMHVKTVRYVDVNETDKTNRDLSAEHGSIDTQPALYVVVFMSVF
jgi:hypothetical protein